MQTVWTRIDLVLRCGDWEILDFAQYCVRVHPMINSLLKNLSDDANLPDDDNV